MAENVILYSTGCPQCKVLKAKLDAKHIQYQLVTDSYTMMTLGMSTVPQLAVEGEIMDFKSAVDWVNKQ